MHSVLNVGDTSGCSYSYPMETSPGAAGHCSKIKMQLDELKVAGSCCTTPLSVEIPNKEVLLDGEFQRGRKRDTQNLLLNIWGAPPRALLVKPQAIGKYLLLPLLLSC